MAARGKRMPPRDACGLRLRLARFSRRVSIEKGNVKGESFLNTFSAYCEMRGIRMAALPLYRRCGSDIRLRATALRV